MHLLENGCLLGVPYNDICEWKSSPENSVATNFVPGNSHLHFWRDELSFTDSLWGILKFSLYSVCMWIPEVPLVPTNPSAGSTPVSCLKTRQSFKYDLNSFATLMAPNDRQNIVSHIMLKKNWTDALKLSTGFLKDQVASVGYHSIATNASHNPITVATQ